MKSKKILSDMTVPYTSLSPTTSEAELRKTYSRHWTAMRAGLYLISVTGCCVVQELAEALADQFGWKNSSFAARYTYTAFTTCNFTSSRIVFSTKYSRDSRLNPLTY